MFTVITLGYDHGDVKPKYTTLYATLAAYGCNTNEERLSYLSELMEESLEMYAQNKAGYHPH